MDKDEADVAEEEEQLLRSHESRLELVETQVQAQKAELEKEEERDEEEEQEKEKTLLRFIPGRLLYDFDHFVKRVLEAWAVVSGVTSQLVPPLFIGNFVLRVISIVWTAAVLAGGIGSYLLWGVFTDGVKAYNSKGPGIGNKVLGEWDKLTTTLPELSIPLGSLDGAVETAVDDMSSYADDAIGTVRRTVTAVSGEFDSLKQDVKGEIHTAVSGAKKVTMRAIRGVGAGLKDVEGVVGEVKDDLTGLGSSVHGLSRELTQEIAGVTDKLDTATQALGSQVDTLSSSVTSEGEKLANQTSAAVSSLKGLVARQTGQITGEIATGETKVEDGVRDELEKLLTPMGEFGREVTSRAVARVKQVGDGVESGLTGLATSVGGAVESALSAVGSVVKDAGGSLHTAQSSVQLAMSAAMHRVSELSSLMQACVSGGGSSCAGSMASRMGISNVATFITGSIKTLVSAITSLGSNVIHGAASGISHAVSSVASDIGIRRRRRRLLSASSHAVSFVPTSSLTQAVLGYRPQGAVAVQPFDLGGYPSLSAFELANADQGSYRVYGASYLRWPSPIPVSGANAVRGVWDGVLLWGALLSWLLKSQSQSAVGLRTSTARVTERMDAGEYFPQLRPVMGSPGVRFSSLGSADPSLWFRGEILRPADGDDAFAFPAADRVQRSTVLNAVLPKWNALGSMASEAALQMKACYGGAVDSDSADSAEDMASSIPRGSLGEAARCASGPTAVASADAKWITLRGAGEGDLTLTASLLATMACALDPSQLDGRLAWLSLYLTAAAGAGNATRAAQLVRVADSALVWATDVGCDAWRGPRGWWSSVYADLARAVASNGTNPLSVPDFPHAAGMVELVNRTQQVKATWTAAHSIPAEAARDNTALPPVASPKPGFLATMGIHLPKAIHVGHLFNFLKSAYVSKDDMLKEYHPDRPELFRLLSQCYCTGYQSVTQVATAYARMAVSPTACRMVKAQRDNKLFLDIAYPVVGWALVPRFESGKKRCNDITDAFKLAFRQQASVWTAGLSDSALGQTPVGKLSRANATLCSEDPFPDDITHCVYLNSNEVVGSAGVWLAVIFVGMMFLFVVYWVGVPAFTLVSHSITTPLLVVSTQYYQISQGVRGFNRLGTGNSFMDSLVLTIQRIGIFFGIKAMKRVSASESYRRWYRANQALVQSISNGTVKFRVPTK